MVADESASNADGSSPRRHLLGLAPPELRAWFADAAQPGYRADQVLDWIYAKRVSDFAQMTNLSKRLREWLAAHADVFTGIVQSSPPADDGTRKILVTWPDGNSVECVWIPDGARHTACISSQSGCPVGCRFCASGLDGLQRDLTVGEIVEQVLHVDSLVAAADVDRGGGGAHVTNLVFMGMGEPLANYDAVVAAIRILNAPSGPNIGARRITVSTVGLPKQIRRLADEGLQLNLALSLHAADEELRQELIPWGRVPLDDLLAACGYYFSQTGREITLEYILLDGVNMRSTDAQRLAAITRRLRCNVNLLRYNPVPGVPFERPSAEAAHRFQQALRSQGVNAHIRTSRGRDIDAACGQLRRRTRPPKL